MDEPKVGQLQTIMGVIGDEMQLEVWMSWKERVSECAEGELLKQTSAQT